MNIAAIIIGIDGWEKYTLPLIESIERYEPDCKITVVDNDSNPPYPIEEPNYHRFAVTRTRRLCYSAAINWGARYYDTDWLVVLSNDVLCTGPFHDMLMEYRKYEGHDLVGPLMKEIDIEHVGKVHYIEGWAVAIPKRIWNTIGGWDEGMQISSYEDVEYSHRARTHGFGLVEDKALPFVHLDQKQRFYLVPNYWDSEYHNRARFIEKYGQRVVA